ncbi:Hypothetical predicted protein [Cloeon dipterum]|uniref:Anion exchange protein n=1 Tax=Cloeon dipterum TaxID=197152 RepID=A0A8S1DKI6_9INSE|nr:Hypothetical predicted protein [Cloeon dipterum]
MSGAPPGDDGARQHRPSVISRRSSKESHHGVEAGSDLDEEMEKVFAMGSGETKFDVSRLSTSPGETPQDRRKFDERDYSQHRKKSYPHTHAPLKSIHSRSMRRRLTSPRLSESEAADLAASVLAEHEDDEARSSRERESLGSADEPVQRPEGAEGGASAPIPVPLSGLSEDEPQVSEMAASYRGKEFDEDTTRRVQFQIGGAGEGRHDDSDREEDTPPKDSKESSPMKSDGSDKGKRRRYSKHKIRKYSLQEDPQWRVRAGSEAPSETSLRPTLDGEEAATLVEMDQDDLTSHRFDDAKGMRRYKTSKSSIGGVAGDNIVSISRRDGNLVPVGMGLPLGAQPKKLFDHSPHAVFVQLDELAGIGDDQEWKETARWIKYEEDRLEGADRWGRPHVASLSFHSLLNLRRCLETGVILLDLEEKDLPGVAFRVVEQMAVEELVEAESKAAVMRALLLRHRPVAHHDKFRFGVIKRNASSYTSLQNYVLSDDADYQERLRREEFLRRYSCVKQPNVLRNLAEDKTKPRIVPSMTSVDGLSLAKLMGSYSASKQTSLDKMHASDSNHTVVDLGKEETTYSSSTEDLKKAHNESILKRIPDGAEATTVLVGSVEFLEQPTIAFVRLAEGVLMPSITEAPIPVRFMFILLGPSVTDLDYHEIGRSISTLMSNTHFHNIAYKAADRREILSAINEFLDDSIVLPPGNYERKALLPFNDLKAKSEAIRRRKSTRDPPDEMQRALLLEEAKKPPEDDPLIRTKRPFGGLIKDIKRRWPKFKSDIVDGLNFQCVAASIFIYFACLSGAITFGGLMGDKTNNQIGISETLVATCLSGVIFALLSGQPLVIVGTTGPLLLFDESLFAFCEEYGIEFLSLRVWIGAWLVIIGLIVVCVEGSVLVKRFTRFTEEIFASLISLLYIYESFVKLYHVFKQHPLQPEYCDFQPSPLVNSSSLSRLDESYSLLLENSSTALMDMWNTTVAPTSQPGPIIKENQPNTALLCVILAFGTFFIAYYLRQFRNSKFLGRSARRALGDFGVPIAIVIMVSLDYMITNTYTDKLRVPEGLSPSSPGDRGWIINPGGKNKPLEVWVAIACAVPAVLVYILLFMETHICELIIDKKERKLKKGSGFHLDIVLVCMLNMGCGLMGAPWICAATVRSVAHVSALTVMSRDHAPGDKPHIIEVKEQRMTALAVSVLVGISVAMAPFLRLVPIAVLFGVFLYMGVSSMTGIQFFERVQLFLMPVKHHPQVPYVRRVKTAKMHLFTIIQVICLATLWVVKSTPASLAFPFFLILMVPIRTSLQHIFSPRELRALDGAQVDEDEDEPDFYAQAHLPG